MQEQKGLLVLAITMLVAACLLWAGIPTLTPAVGPASSPRASNNALTAQLAAGESSDKAVNDRTLLTSVEPSATTVRCQVFRGWETPFPGAHLRLQWCPIGATEPAWQGQAFADAEGIAVVSVPTTATPCTVRFLPGDDNACGRAAEATCMHGITPPCCQLHLFPFDAEVTGLVTDASDRPLANARVSWSRDHKAIPCDAEGRFSLRVPSLMNDLRCYCMAPGFLPARENVVLAPGGHIDLRVRLAPGQRIMGHVRDAAGQPIAGAKVLSILQQIAGEPATSDVEGRYELDCALGQWGQEQVIVRCAGYQPASVRLPVALGVTEKDFVLQPAATLHGRVVFADGRPVAGAAVHTLSDGYFGDGAAATTTAADGRFTLDGLAPGEATVCAEAAGFAATTQSGEAARDVGSPELVLVLTPGMTASGDVVDERGAPVAGTSVRAGSKDQQTDARGRFVLAGLALDVSHVDIVGANHVRLENAPLQSGSANHFVVQRAGALVGCVVDRATGIPLEDFTVRIVSGPGGIGADWAREGRHFQNTHGLWRTEREPMSPGDAYMLRVMAPGHASRVGSVVASLDPEPRSTIGLDQGVLVRGMLLDSLDNSPIANAEVQLLELPPETRSFESKPRKVTASATGRFTLPAVSADQIWLQVAAPARLTTVAGPFTLPAVGEADLLVRVGAGAVILGVLRDDSGAPLADVELQAQNLAQGNERLLHCKARTDDHGRFRIAGLPAGKAYLSTTVLRGNDLLVFARRFELQEGNNPFDLTPRGTGTLELEVGGDTQKGSLRIDMIEPNADQDGPLFVVLPRSERITLRGLPAGAYKVWYTEFSGRREDRPVAREVRVVVGATEPAHARLDCSR